MSNQFLDAYEDSGVLGHGSFGIIRKVVRKSDGLVFARKELNFERMTERDRRQIVAEVNILKDLHHPHIVRYHDRYVDRDNGVLYILMEYCGGGDLSTIIKNATRSGKPIPEDVVWGYFMQLLLALVHCHHPNVTTPGEGKPSGDENKRVQILHRDLKPDNVFLDDANKVKLGDFGLSKALAQASFANTYVGTPYYMSPELMQEKAYDSKSDIWSLGCLIYELCALKPPFHEARTHAELSGFIRNGRIPPLPRGYSQSLSSVIKSMLNLNPAMRPSAAQLLQHERLELVFKVTECEKMLATVKAHKATVVAKEREVAAREQAMVDKEAHIVSVLASKDTQISSLQQHVSQLQHQPFPPAGPPKHEIDALVHAAVSRREEELRVAVRKREEEVAAAMTRREEELKHAVQRREEELSQAWIAREAEVRAEVSSAVQVEMQTAFEEAWQIRDEELRRDLTEAAEEQIGREVEERHQANFDRWQEERAKEQAELDHIRADLETKLLAIEQGPKEKTPLEEVKNLLKPLEKLAETHVATRPRKHSVSIPTPKPSHRTMASVSTPIARPSARPLADFMPSAMKGVVLTSTGQPIETPIFKNRFTPPDLANVFANSPKVGLNFAKCFDFDREVEGDEHEGEAEFEADLSDVEVARREPPSPSKRERAGSSTSMREKMVRTRSERPALTTTKSSKLFTKTESERPARAHTAEDQGSSSSSNGVSSQAPQPPVRATRLRRPSIRTTTASSSARPAINSATSMPASMSDLAGPSTAPSRPPSARAVTATFLPTSTAPPASAIQYDLSDEENLPSPFLKRTEKDRTAVRGATVPTIKKRTSNGNLLRTLAAANSADSNTNGTIRRGGTAASLSKAATSSGVTRPSVIGARQASEQARKALLRP